MEKNTISINIASDDAGIVLYNLGFMYYYGLGVGKNINRAVEFLTLSANEGYNPAKLLLAQFYYNDGKLSVQVDGKTVEKTSLEIIDLLSGSLSEGNKQAFSLLEKITNNVKDVETLYKIANIYMDKNPSYDDYSKAFIYLKKALRPDWNGGLNGIIYAKLGTMYYYGMGVKKSKENAIECFTKAAKSFNDGDEVTIILKKIADEDCDPEMQYLTGVAMQRKDDYNALKYLLLAQANGFIKANIQLALCYIFGDCGVEKDEEKAAELLYTAAKKGNKEAYDMLEDEKKPAFQYKLGLLLHEGVEGLIEKNDITAIESFKKAAENNHNESKLALANMYIDVADAKNLKKSHDYGTRERFEEGFDLMYSLAKDGYENALKRLEELEYLGYGEADYYLGCLCYDKKDYEKAAEHFKKAAENGITDTDAQIALGKMYYNGEGVEKDIHKAVEYISRAARDEEAFYYLKDSMANCGVAEASYAVAQHYIVKVECDYNDSDYKEAEKYIEMAAYGGIREAQYLAGNMQRGLFWDPVYINEDSISNGRFTLTEEIRKEYETAAAFYLMAIAQENENELYNEHAGEKYSLGTMYYYGIGVEQSYDEALKYYKMAANQGHIGAQYKIGTIYSLGEDVKNSDDISVEFQNTYDDAGEPVDVVVIKVKTSDKKLCDRSNY